jgi:hypothetical protein
LRVTVLSTKVLFEEDAAQYKYARLIFAEFGMVVRGLDDEVLRVQAL